MATQQHNWSGSGYVGTSGQNFLFSLTNGYKISHCTGQHMLQHPQYNNNSMDLPLVEDMTSISTVSINGGYCNLGHNYGCQTGSYG